MSPIIFAFFVYFLQVANGNDCDKLGVIIYEELGCKPVFIQGEDCPVKYDCDLKVINNTCLYGKLKIPVGERIPQKLTEGTCQIGCECKGIPKILEEGLVLVQGKFSCSGHIDCPEFLGGLIPGKGCHRIRARPGECCSQGILCDTAEDPVARCKVNSNLTVLEGQNFYPPNTCWDCFCSKNFNGKIEEPHCRRVGCAAQLHYQTEIIDHCAPFYTSAEALCCPTEWICPLENDKIVTLTPKADQKSDLKCKFGKRTLKLGEGFETITKIWFGSKEVKAKCECILPPFLTCKEVPN